MTTRDPRIWRELPGGRAVHRRYIAPGMLGRRTVLIELTKPHPSIPGCYGARNLIAGEELYTPDWVAFDQLQERHITYSYEYWAAAVDKELAAMSRPSMAQLPYGSWQEMYAKDYAPGNAANWGYRSHHLTELRFRTWREDVDAELRSLGYPPTADLFAAGWRDLWAAGYTPADAVRVGLELQREAVKGFYHDSDSEGEAQE